jgi:hypothetical protein
VTGYREVLMIKSMAAGAFAALLFSTNALADSTLGYRSDGGCTGDFERVELKSQWLRVDSGQGGDATGSMIYDHAEKLAYFIDDRSHSFLETELDEDAVDLQTDIMKSLRTKLRKESGVDPFEMAKSLCPGVSAGNHRDRQPGEGMDCGNGTTFGSAAIGADGKPMSPDEMKAAMKNGQMPMDAGTQQMMQKMMEQQLAKMSPEQRAQVQSMMTSGGGSPSMPGMPGMPGVPGANAVKAPPRIDRDAGEIDVDGITCMRREHLRGDEMLREDCYAKAAALHLGDVETRRVARFSEAIQDWSRSLTPNGPQAQADDRVLVRRVCYAAGQASGHATLTINNAPIAESRFEVPSGYKRMDLGMGQPRNRESD